jgi:hypothetical protein
MVSVSPETWDRLQRAYDGAGLAQDFRAAWQNGEAFLAATHGLRGRRPVVIEWKGSHRAPGDEVAPVDLRIDHVFLISCKYLSRVMINASPAHLFERLLQGRHGVRGGDWFAEVAPREYQQLYRVVRESVGLTHLPTAVTELGPDDRNELVHALSAGWPQSTNEAHTAFVDAVAIETARRWQAATRSLTTSEALLWRLLRMGSAPYFVLGASATAQLRLRVATPWDWRLNFRLRAFQCSAQAGGQPRVGWIGQVEDRHSGAVRQVGGHVEIRWSHGQFGGNPEAKVYLDTPHNDVPGYFRLR